METGEGLNFPAPLSCALSRKICIKKRHRDWRGVSHGGVGYLSGDPERGDEVAAPVRRGGGHASRQTSAYLLAGHLNLGEKLWQFKDTMKEKAHNRVIECLCCIVTPLIWRVLLHSLKL